MYIFVFVFMLMGVLGLYTQVFTLQASKQFARQSAVGDTMLLYHNVSYAWARHNDTGVTALVNDYCYQTFNASVKACSWGTVTIGAEQYNLPVGYNTASFAFQSVIYNTGTASYLLTFVAPPGASRVNEPAASPALGFSVAQIFQQMRNTQASMLLYGVVKGSVFYTKMKDIDKVTSTPYTITYPLLSTLSLYEGTVGFLSPL